MSPGQVAGIIAALAVVALVAFTSYVLVKIGAVLDELRLTVRGLTGETAPLIREVTSTVTGTNAQLGKVDVITSNVASATSNVSALTSLFAATLGSPIIRVAAYSYGVRQALAGRRGRRS